MTFASRCVICAWGLAVGIALPQARATDPLPAPDLASIQQQLARQEAELRALRARLAAVEEATTPLPSVGPAAEASPGGASALYDSISGANAVSLAPAMPQPPSPPTSPSAPAQPSQGERLSAVEAQLRKIFQSEEAQRAADASTPTARIAAQLQVDNYFFGQTPANRAAVGDIEDGTAFRRARFGWFGDYETTFYRIEMDFALSGRPSFLDVFGGVHDLPVVNNLRIGHFFEPYSLERLTSNRFVTFMERSLPDQPFAPGRNTGICANDWSENERVTWAYGVFRASSDAFGDNQSETDNSAVTGRLTWLPYFDEASGGRYYVHLGGAYSFRDSANYVASFASQPEARLGATSPNVPNFVNTGNIATNFYQLFGTEVAWIHGPFSLQTEFMWVPLDRRDGPDPSFSSYYITASYFLTGESRPYNRRLGIFDRVTPFEEFFRVRAADGSICSGWGAWEVAGRISYLDLNSAGIQGGELTDLTVGLNWYLTPSMRLTFNYIHAFLDSPVNGESSADIIGMRVGYEF